MAYTKEQKVWAKWSRVKKYDERFARLSAQKDAELEELRLAICAFMGNESATIDDFIDAMEMKVVEQSAAMRSVLGERAHAEPVEVEGQAAAV